MNFKREDINNPKYWFKSGYSSVFLFRNINEEWTNENGGMICPERMREKYGKDVFLLIVDADKTVNGLIQVNFANLTLNENFIHSYWVTKGILEEELD